MSRPLKYTSEEFTKAYQQSHSMKELMAKLHCTAMTVYAYCKRLCLPLLQKPTGLGSGRSRLRLPKYNPVALARRYCREATVKEVAKEAGMYSSTFKHYLRMLVNQPQRFYLTKSCKPPLRICHIKIINYLIKRPFSEHINPNELVHLLALKPSQVEEYWKYAYHLTLDLYPPSTKYKPGPKHRLGPARDPNAISKWKVLRQEQEKKKSWIERATQ